MLPSFFCISFSFSLSQFLAVYIVVFLAVLTNYYEREREKGNALADDDNSLHYLSGLCA